MWNIKVVHSYNWFQCKLHQEDISAIRCSKLNPNIFFTASYDGYWKVNQLLVSKSWKILKRRGDHANLRDDSCIQKGRKFKLSCTFRNNCYIGSFNREIFRTDRAPKNSGFKALMREWKGKGLAVWDSLTWSFKVSHSNEQSK